MAFFWPIVVKNKGLWSLLHLNFAFVNFIMRPIFRVNNGYFAVLAPLSLSIKLQLAKILLFSYQCYPSEPWQGQIILIFNITYRNNKKYFKKFIFFLNFHHKIELCLQNQIPTTHSSPKALIVPYTLQNCVKRTMSERSISKIYLEKCFSRNTTRIHSWPTIVCCNDALR